MQNSLDVIIHTSEKATISITPLDQFGKPFILGAVVPVWKVSTGTVVPVVATDGLSAVIPATDVASDNVIDITVAGQSLAAQILFHCDVTPPPPQVLSDFGLKVVSVEPK